LCAVCYEVNEDLTLTKDAIEDLIQSQIQKLVSSLEAVESSCVNDSAHNDVGVHTEKMAAELIADNAISTEANVRHDLLSSNDDSAYDGDAMLDSADKYYRFY
jgi:hypothetical protein